MQQRSAVSDRLGFLALFALACLGLAGAASRPEGGMLLALPGPVTSLVVLGLLVALAALSEKGTGRAALPMAVLPVLWLFWPSMPGVRALSGPAVLPLVASVAIGGLAGISPSSSRWARHLFPLVLVLVYFSVAARVQARVGPEGDEPQYLMVADSLLRDHDLDLRRGFALERYRAFHQAPLEPHFRVRGRHDEIYSVHAVGLPLLLLPAYAAFGYSGASFFMAFLSVLLALQIRKLLRCWTEDEALSEGVSWAVALSPPLVHYAGLLFTEVPAALLLAFALRRAREKGASLRTVLSWSAALAFLPWLNVRYAVLPVIVFAYFLSQRPRIRSIVAAAAPLVVSAALVAGYHFVLYGFMDPRRVYGRHREFSVTTLPEGIPGLLLDQEFGLLVYAPLFVLALPGAVRLLRAKPREGLATLILVSVVLLTAGSWDMWRGGFNPPARFLLPVVPLLAAAVAFELRKGLGAAGCLLVAWGLWTGLSGAWRPELVHRDRDGTAPFFRAESGAAEWTRLLPGYVLREADRRSLALCWAIALGAAAFPWPSPKRTLPRQAVVLIGLLCATGVSSRASQRRSEGRDAVRVMGQDALVAPGLAFEPHSVALWTPDETDWGSLFEPQKFPGGALLGGRLRLAPGRYALDVRLDPKIPVPADLPELLAVGEERYAPGKERTAPLFREGEGLSGDFFVEESESAVSISLIRGGPLVIREVLLRRTPGTVVWTPRARLSEFRGGRGSVVE